MNGHYTGETPEENGMIPTFGQTVDEDFPIRYADFFFLNKVNDKSNHS